MSLRPVSSLFENNMLSYINDKTLFIKRKSRSSVKLWEKGENKRPIGLSLHLYQSLLVSSKCI